MTYILIAVVLLLAFERYITSRDFLDLLEAERRKGREERERLLDFLRTQTERQEERDRSHRLEIAQLNQARMEETANLLQRIQAPEQAVTSHVAETAPPDPPPLNLESDEELFAAYEERMRGLVSG